MSSINLREIISVAPLDESSESSEIYAFEDDGRCTLVVQPIKDTHPTYLVIPSMKERVGARIIKCVRYPEIH